MDNNEKDKAMKQCVCGGKHFYRKYFFLNESRCPGSLILQNGFPQAIEDKQAMNEKPRMQIERAKQFTTSAASN
jgi:hypothetical protein